MPNKAIETSGDLNASPDKTGGNQVAPGPVGSGRKISPEINVDESKSMLLNQSQNPNSSRVDVYITPQKNTDQQGSIDMSDDIEDSEELDEEQLMELER